MSNPPPPGFGVPPPLESDDDDVAWALQTAAAQWKAGSYQDALVWIRRAVDSAIDAGHPERAAQINRLEATLSDELRGRQRTVNFDDQTEVVNPFDAPMDPAQLMDAAEEEGDTPALPEELEQLEPREVSLLPYEIEELQRQSQLPGGPPAERESVPPISVEPERISIEVEPLSLPPSPPAAAPARPSAPRPGAPSASRPPVSRPPAREPTSVSRAPAAAPRAPAVSRAPAPPRATTTSGAPPAGRAATGATSRAPLPRAGSKPPTAAAAPSPAAPPRRPPPPPRPGGPASAGSTSSPSMPAGRRAPISGAPRPSSEPPPASARREPPRVHIAPSRPPPEAAAPEPSPSEEPTLVGANASSALLESAPPERAAVSEHPTRDDALLIRSDAPSAPEGPSTVSVPVEPSPSDPPETVATVRPDVHDLDLAGTLPPDLEPTSTGGHAAADELQDISRTDPPTELGAASPSDQTQVGVPSLLGSSETPPESLVTQVEDVDLMDVRGLQDLPEEAQADLVRRVRIEQLDQDEEVSAFGVALVLQGWVSVMPTVVDAACGRSRRGDVVFTAGTLTENVGLRVVAGEDGTRVAIWDHEALHEATRDFPWVADELRTVADRFQALAGACMGPMGDRLDDSLRLMVTDRCEVRRLLPGETLVERGHQIPGLFVIGAGSVEVADETGSVGSELASGDFLFAEQVLSAGSAPATARAGSGGALVLFAPRRTAHELMVVVPPLLEILAG